MHDFTSHSKYKRSDFLPAAAMFYTDIQNLYGLDEPVDYGSGIEYADGLSGTAIQIGLWLNGTKGCQDMIDGSLDSRIDHLVHYMGVHSKAPHIFLRVGYEFDNPDFRYTDPAVYQQAYRLLVDACRRPQKCAQRVDFVWHSWGASLTTADQLLEYYPGDEYANYVGVSLFNQFYPNSTAGSLDETVRPVLDLAQELGKPIIIAESTPFGGIDALEDPWGQWFEPVLELIEEYDIAMWSYIDCDWTNQPMWKYAGFGDTRLALNQTVMSNWQKQVFENPRFLYSSQVEGLHHCPRPRPPSMQLPLGTLNAGLYQQLSMSMYWIGAIAIAFLAICFQYFCKCSHDNNYVELQHGSEDEVYIDPNRTGYGTLETK
jgi:hypothetical protein